MNRIIKLIPTALVLVTVISLTTAIGCNDDQGDKSEEFTKEELSQLIADSNQITNEADYYRMNLNMDISMEMSGGDEEETMSIDMTMEGFVDQKNMEIQMMIAMDMDIQMIMPMDMDDLGDNSMNMDMDMYMVDGYIYMKADIFGSGEEWIKMPATEDAMSMYNMNMVEQQMAPLESLAEASFLRYETYDGSECYVIELVPDMEAMMGWLNTQDMTSVEFDWDDLDKLNDMFQELSYTCWIDKETKYMKKITAYMQMSISAEDFDELNGDVGTLIMDTTMNMEMSDYNEPVTITLPEEALEAKEFGL